MPDSDSPKNIPDSGTRAPMTTEINGIFQTTQRRDIRSAVLLAAVWKFHRNWSFPDTSQQGLYNKKTFAEVFQQVHL